MHRSRQLGPPFPNIEPNPAAASVIWAGDAEDDDPSPDDGLHEDEDGLEEGPDDAGMLIEPFEDEEGIELDDANAADLDVGIELDEPSDHDDDPAAEVVLDIGQLLDGADERQRLADDDAAGPVELDDGLGVEEPPEDATSSAELGLGEPYEDLSDGLPGLDADDEGDFTGDPSLLELDTSRDDPPPPWADEHWQQGERVIHDPCSAIAWDGGRVVVGGEGLWRIDREVLPLDLEPRSRVISLALIGGDNERLLVATAAGALWRMALDGRVAEARPGWRSAAGLPAGDPTTLELLEMGSGMLLARTSSGRLLRSGDGGDSWQVVELRAKVLAVAQSSAPQRVLVEGRSGLNLLTSTDTGLSWTPTLLPRAARDVLGDDETPMLAHHADLVALGTSSRGVALSLDGGQSFELVPGCQRGTALTAGSFESEPCAWLAQYSETEERTELVAIHRGLARRVGALEGESAAGEDVARIQALAWDGRRLWAVGQFGLSWWARRSSA